MIQYADCDWRCTDILIVEASGSNTLNGTSGNAAPNWRSCFYHPTLKLYIIVYVDDFKNEWPQENQGTGVEAHKTAA